MISNLRSTAYQGWLIDLPRPLAEKLLSLAETVTIEAGQIIYHIGDATNSLWCVRQGIARMNLATNESAHRFGHLIGPGFWFGEFELLTGHPRLVEMQAVTKCKLQRFSKGGIEKLAVAEPELWKWIGILSAQHTVLALSAADDLMIKKPLQRTAALLLRLSGNRASHPAGLPRDVILVQQQELSEALNLSRSSVGAILRKMENEGVLSFEYRKIRILNCSALISYLPSN